MRIFVSTHRLSDQSNQSNILRLDHSAPLAAATTSAYASVMEPGDPTYTHEDILLPLAITVIIDKKVRTPEMQSLTTQAKGLFELFDLDVWTVNQIRDWFKANEKALKAKLGSERRNTLVLRALSRFKIERDVEAVYDAMVSISVSDKEYVVPESELIKSAGSIWGFPRPPIKVDRES